VKPVALIYSKLVVEPG